MLAGSLAWFTSSRFRLPISIELSFFRLFTRTYSRRLPCSFLSFAHEIKSPSFAASSRCELCKQQAQSHSMSWARLLWPTRRVVFVQSRFVSTRCWEKEVFECKEKKRFFNPRHRRTLITNFNSIILKVKRSAGLDWTRLDSSGRWGQRHGPRLARNTLIFNQ